MLNTRREEKQIPAIIDAHGKDFKLCNRLVWGEVLKILPVDINHREVGVHHILSRFLTELICRYPDEITFLSREETILYCTEALACQALECQHKAGFWKKNGTSLTYTLHYYTNISHGFKSPFLRIILSLDMIKTLHKMQRSYAFDGHKNSSIALCVNG